MLEAFFEPVSKVLLKGISKEESLMAHKIHVNTGKFPDMGKVDVAIIGIGNNATEVRKHLYKYAFHLNGIEVADLGNLKHKGTEKNINAGLTECLILLKEQNIIPIVIGENHHYGSALAKAIDFAKVDYALVAPDIAFEEKDLAYQLNAKNRLFHASFIAYQNYLNSTERLQAAASVFSESLRLGNVRSDIALTEPLLRQADIFEFDLTAIKYAEFQSSLNPLPNGLLNNEACAICRYAGISNSIGVYVLRNFALTAAQSVDAQQVAQMLWYILDGIDNRFNDFPQMNHRNFTVYKCHSTDGVDMVFLNSNLTGRWWLQIPAKAKGKKSAPKFIGCTEADFEIAREGDVPEKWYRAAGMHL
ncbi:MAG: hypothetical protein V4613_10035 [Bacteroidota bacterium]